VLNFDKLVKSQDTPVFVIPAKAGIQETQSLVDSRSPIRSRTSFAGVTALETFYETINFKAKKKRFGTDNQAALRKEEEENGRRQQEEIHSLVC